MSENSSVSASTPGIGFCGLLGLLFIGLKLTGYINWSWWLVLAPLYGGCGCALFVFLGIVIVALLAGSRGRGR